MRATLVDASAAPAARPDAAAVGPELVLQALADPTRWQIVQHLAAAELCTTHLQSLLDTKQPVMSHHLKVLREAGLVVTEPCGRYTYYRLRPGALDELAADLGGLAESAHRLPPRRSC